MADMDRVELLIGLANNMRAENNDWRNQVWREGRERAERLKAMIARFENEYGALNQELDLLRQYLPRQQEQLPKVEPMPKVVGKGPA